jgi:hypothetical protein
MLLLAIGVALDGGALAEAAEVPALMVAWAVAVVLIDRWEGIGVPGAVAWQSSG